MTSQRPWYSRVETGSQERHFTLMEEESFREFMGHFPRPVQAAYPVMGIVTDQDQQILWDRVNRSTIRTIRSPQEIAAVLTGNLSELSQAKR